MRQQFLADARGALSRRTATVHRRLFAAAATLGVVVAFAGYLAPGASASVLTTGDVTPANNPFQPGNQGLPIDGNFINPFEPVDRQTFFEGRHTDNGQPANQSAHENINANIFVGQTSSGTLLITGESALRYMNLVIGDRGMVNGQMRNGTGVVRITGFGSVFNNDFNIIPPNLPTNFSSVNPRALEPSLDGLDGADDGFDLYVGRWGSGTLEITAGGRAEIHDAVIVADQPGSVGNIIVDGLDSALISGGFDSGTATEIHQMIIGRRGNGFLTVANGATVISEAPAQSPVSQVVPMGAVIGSDPMTTQEPQPGGQGTVNVTGFASKWIVGGSLQIGGFDRGTLGIGEGFGPDVQGLNVEYNSEAGRGTLRVADDALVSAIWPIDVDPGQPQEDLLLAIGRFGRLELAGGTVSVGTGGDDASRSDRVLLINDGVITGSGRIDTGVFRNRYFGEVRVNPGERLLIDSSSEFRDIGLTEDEPPLVNWGSIQVMGLVDARAELEFERAPDAPQDPLQPFRNLRVERPSGAPPTQFHGGIISAQHATLRFRSGIVNDGMMAFTAGNNYVTGHVFNRGNPDEPEEPADRGVIVVSGLGTRVTFENDLVNAGVLDVGGGASIDVLSSHSFLTDGELNVNLSLAHPAPINVAGDIGLGGLLNISLASDITSTLKHGDSFEIISFTGEAFRVDDDSEGKPEMGVPLPQFSQGFQEFTVAPDIPWMVQGLTPFVERIDQGIYLSFLDMTFDPGDPNGPGGPIRPDAVPPDFNGDGVVDEQDLAIWLANVGIASGAAPWQGDANGDGRVDGADFIIWQRNVGMDPPWNGAGAGAGAGLLPSVPEPGALAMLLSAAWLALLACGRRRC